jgi:hypothetical protein
MLKMLPVAKVSEVKTDTVKVSPWQIRVGLTTGVITGPAAKVRAFKSSMTARSVVANFILVILKR